MNKFKEEVIQRVTEFYKVYLNENRQRKEKYYMLLIVLYSIFSLSAAAVIGLMFDMTVNVVSLSLFLGILYCIYRIISIILNRVYSDPFINLTEYDTKSAFAFLTFIILKKEYAYFSISALKCILDDDTQKICCVNYTDRNNVTHKFNLSSISNSDLLEDTCQIQEINVEQIRVDDQSVKFKVTGITVHLSYISDEQQ